MNEEHNSNRRFAAAMMGSMYAMFGAAMKPEPKQPTGHDMYRIMRAEAKRRAKMQKRAGVAK